VIKKAYAWCLTTETDGDGIIENTTGGLGAIEVGAIGERIHQDIYLASVWVAALEAMQEMAASRGRPRSPARPRPSGRKRPARSMRITGSNRRGTTRSGSSWAAR
jgi:hypothetical protein